MALGVFLTTLLGETQILPVAEKVNGCGPFMCVCLCPVVQHHPAVWKGRGGGLGVHASAYRAGHHVRLTAGKPEVRSFTQDESVRKAADPAQARTRNRLRGTV